VRTWTEATPSPGAIRIVRDLATAADAELAALLEGATAVVHLAARVHVMRETLADSAAAYQAANVVATARLAQAAVQAGATRFVFASTVKVNGESTAPGRPFHPDDPPAPPDAYARSKLDAERELGRICAGTSLAPVILRLPLVYGPGVAGNFLALEDEIARGHALPLGAIRNRRSGSGTGNLVEGDRRCARARLHRAACISSPTKEIGVPISCAHRGVIGVRCLRDRKCFSRGTLGPARCGRSSHGVARSRSYGFQCSDGLEAAPLARAWSRGDRALVAPAACDLKTDRHAPL
jgi:hypothetical protein